MQTNILEYLEATAPRLPNKIAYSDGTDNLTFAELFHHARALGSELAKMGYYRRPIAVLMKNPEFYERMKDSLRKEDFTVAEHGRLFEVITEKIADRRALELTLFSQELTAEQMNLLVKICKQNEGLNFGLTVCADCVSVMREEKIKKQQMPSIESLSDEEFAALFKNKK